MILTNSIVPNMIWKISECSISPNPGLGGACDRPLLKAPFDFRRTAPWERAQGVGNVRSEGHAGRKKNLTTGKKELFVYNIFFFLKNFFRKIRDTDLIVRQCFGLSQKEKGNHPGVRRASQRMPQAPEHFKENPPK